MWTRTHTLNGLNLNGVYALHICLNHDVGLNVGALGETAFAKGNYVYVGSAQRNFEQRVKRHLRKNKKVFWHIDYFLANKHAKICKVLCKIGDKSEECVIAKELAKQGEVIQGFGCSDCRCHGHLFRFPFGFAVEELEFFSSLKGWSEFEA